MNNNTKQRIQDLIYERDRTVKELRGVLSLGPAIIHRHLKDLVTKGTITKIGSAPKVVYRKTVTQIQKTPTHSFTSEELSLLEKQFIDIDASGNRRNGAEGFLYWCAHRKFDPTTRIKEYVHTIEKYESQRQNGVLDATEKLLHSFDSAGPERMWYVDVYSYEIFDKTKLGQLVLYGKQNPNRTIINEITQEVSGAIQQIINTQKVDAVAFVAPTVQRKTQLMREMEHALAIDLPRVSVHKIMGEITIPQKTLKSKQDRQKNAHDTFMVSSQSTYNTVLLIDDAVGSGASFYEIGKKIRERGIAKRVIAISFVGSANDFPIINEA